MDKTLEWEDDFEPELGLGRFRQFAPLEIDGIVSQRWAPNSLFGTVTINPMFSVRHDPENDLDWATAWRWRPDKEVDLDHYVFCGLLLDADRVHKGYEHHHCLIPDWYNERNASG